MQAQRYFAERAFQDAKSELGMGNYQFRSWQLWRYHITLVMVAMLFMVGVRLTQQREISLLSTADVIVPLANYLPRRGHVKEELFRQM